MPVLINLRPPSIHQSATDSHADLKNTSDDAIPNYLGSLKFRQSHTLVDTRLALGYSSCAVSAACFLWDFKLGWDATKHYTAVAVGLYMLLSTTLTLWMLLREKSIVYEGTSPAGEKVRFMRLCWRQQQQQKLALTALGQVSISTTTKKNVPMYEVHVQMTTTDGKKIDTTFSRPFSEWFNAQGVFVAQPFQQMFAEYAMVIGKYDTKNFTTDSHKLANMSPGLIDVLLQEESEPSANTAVSAGKKKGRSKKE